MSGEINFKDGELVSCPACGNELGLHFDEIAVEDAAGDLVTLNCYGEDRNSHVDISQTRGRIDANVGRRHRICLVASCEFGHSTFIYLTQHKGTTEVKIESHE